jgi:hypothetical protein
MIDRNHSKTGFQIRNFIAAFAVFVLYQTIRAFVLLDKEVDRDTTVFVGVCGIFVLTALYI